MNRALFILMSVSGVSSLMLIDSAIKGAALLLFAAGVVLFLRRDSSATRHMVWLVAIIALLAMPVLSAMLPQWRVLPDWASVAEVSQQNRDGSDGNNAIYEADLADHTSHASHDLNLENALPFDDALLSPPTDDVSTATTIESPVTAAIPAATVTPIIWTWQHVMTSLWFVGFAMLIIRLAIARASLWRTERNAIRLRNPAIQAQRADTASAGGVSHRIASTETASGLKGRHKWPKLSETMSALRAFALRGISFRGLMAPTEAVSALRACEDCIHLEDSIASCGNQHSENDVYSAFTAACTTLNIRQHVTLLLHPDKTIPVVWGIFRPRLMLPVAAQDWSDEQLRSVLLHELAHIKRRDVLGQLLAQIACALHWFNPLVWLAAWRMHIERERACDDLVLASGVRPSAYAEHLLNVATRLSSSPWTQACGLAMARNSSLHGRLTALLSEKQNRRRVSSTVLAAAMMICTAVVVPVSMLCAADETPSEKADRLQSGKIDFEPTTKSQDNNETLNFRSNTIAAGALAVDEEETTANVVTSSTSEESKKKPSQVEVDFAKVRLAKAKVDLEQRLDANKEYPSFTPSEIRLTELEVEAADAMLRTLSEDADIANQAEIDFAEIGLEKAQVGLKQRLEANEKYPSFGPTEIRESELEVQEADAMLRMLDKDADISKNAAGDLTRLRLAKAKLEAINKLNAELHKDLQRRQSTLNDLNARLAKKKLDMQFAADGVKDKLHVADHSGTYDLGKGRTLNIDASGIDEQWFEIRWPANGDWKSSRLRIPVTIDRAEAAKVRMQPIMRMEHAKEDEDQNGGPTQNSRTVVVQPTIKWQIVWEEDSDDVWFQHSEQTTVVTQVNTANPAIVTATHYYRRDSGADADIPVQIRYKLPAIDQGLFRVLMEPLERPSNDAEIQLKLAAESSADWKVIASKTDAAGKPLGTIALPVKTVVHPAIDVAQTPAAKMIRGRLLKPDGTPAVGYFVYAEDGVNRRNQPTPKTKGLPEPALTKEDGSFEIALEWLKPSAYFLWAAKENLKISEEFAPLEVSVPANGDVGQIRFSKGRTVTGKVVGLNGKGLANVRVSSVRQNPRVQGLYSLICIRTTTTGDDGAFTLPPLGAGKHLLKIETHSLGDDELSIAFANQRIDVPDTEPLHLEGQAVKGNLLLAEQNHDPIEIDFRPLKTVNITLDVTVNRSNPEFNDFEVRISGRLPGMTSADPASWWTRPGRATLTQGHFTIAVPEGLTRASINAAPVYKRIGDKPEFVWQRPNDATPKKIDQLELGTLSEPFGLALTVKDAAE